MPASVQLRASPLSDRSQSSLVGRKRMPFPCKEEKGFMTTEFSCFQVKGKPVLTAFELQLFFFEFAAQSGVYSPWCVLDPVHGDLNWT